MHVHIDEPGADDQPGSIDRFFGGATFPDPHQGAVVDEHVIHAIDALSGIDHPSAANQKPRHADDPFK